jgi:hypothetical protein
MPNLKVQIIVSIGLSTVRHGFSSEGLTVIDVSGLSSGRTGPGTIWIFINQANQLELMSYMVRGCCCFSDATACEAIGGSICGGKASLSVERLSE